MSQSEKEFYRRDNQEEELVNYYGEDAIGRTDSQRISIPGNQESINTLLARASFLIKQKKSEKVKLTNNPNDTQPTSRLLKLQEKMNQVEAQQNIQEIQKYNSSKIGDFRNRLLASNPDLKFKGLND
jgi:hypothetical protein